MSHRIDSEGLVAPDRGGSAYTVAYGATPDSTCGEEVRWAHFVGHGSVQQRSLLKRAFDLLLGVVLSLISLPLVIVLAVGSALAFREWPFFSHFRVGQSGELFRFLKIRSLTSSTPRYADKYALREMQIGRWGSFLRRTHLDELPQLWLVLFGKMSLVGPRPEMPELLMSFDCEFVDRRLSVPQGCTGLWQISAGNVGLIGEAPELDDFYVANWTVRMDLWILWRTLLALAGRTVSGPGRVPNWCLRR